MVAAIGQNARPHMPLLLASVFLFGCDGDGVSATSVNDEPNRMVVVNDGPEGSSALLVNDVRYPLDAALGDIWGAKGEHFQIDFTLTDGNFRLISDTVDGRVVQLLVPAQAGVVFHAKMFSAGNSFDYSSYAYLGSEDSPAGVGYFTNAFVGVDANGNGRVDLAEQSMVLDGVIDFAGALPDIELRLNLTLSDGRIVTGQYTGLFDFTER